MKPFPHNSHRLMKPFPHNSHLSGQQESYNYRISRARVVAEIAYGQLKGRWRRLMKKNEMDISNIPMVISACCVLHNMCEIHESFNNSWLQDNDEHEPQPSSVLH